MGTCEDYAAQMATQPKRMKFTDLTLEPLDNWDFGAMQLADGRHTLVVLLTSAYNGMPPGNARQFAKLLNRESRPDALNGIEFVLSCELVVTLGENSSKDAAYDSLRKAAKDANRLRNQSPGWSVFVAENRTVLGVLRRYAPLVHQIPLTAILHFVLAMTPRRYSIASCQSAVGNSVHISAAIFNDIVNGCSYGSLATEYLVSLEPGTRLSVSHLPAQDAFHLPDSLDVPAVFVGASTGGATLYFGCRNPDWDYLYKDELEQYVKDSTTS